MRDPKAINPEATRLRYASPALTVFGSVRDLTGTKSQVASDSSGKLLGSDRSYKENIVQVDRHPSGFGLYLFEYKADLRDNLGHGRKFGVMADEVERIVPEAVSIDIDGYRKVDYALLGITLQ